MIGLMDCNNFFVSCERLFRPDLRKRPVAVLSSNDGCIVARSQEIKDLGVPMGVPYFQVKDICEKHHAVLFSSNFTLYRDISTRVMQTLKEELEGYRGKASALEVYSIDEAFFELPEGVMEDDIAQIRDRIIQKTGIPVSFGIAPTKTIAKIANDSAKKGTGVCWLTLESALTLYPQISCGSVWGIGRQTSKRLAELGIQYVAGLLEKGLPFSRQEFGVVGERLYLELSGTRAHQEDGGELPASISSTRSFRTTIKEKETLKSALGYHVTQLGEKLRAQGLMTAELSIICAPSRFGPFILRTSTAHQALEAPTNDTTSLLKVAYAIFDTLYDEEVPYKKAGATVSKLIPEEYAVPSLLHEESSKTDVYEVVDSLNERFGRGVVHSGAVMESQTWAPRSEARSPEYTTRWSEIAHVKAI